MAKRNFVILTAAALTLTACQSLLPTGSGKPDGPLSKAELSACLESPHWVGAELASPHPEPGRKFKAGYNFSIKKPNGSYGYGIEEASDGHLLIRYPAHNSATDFEVVRRNGVVYFGSNKTSCE
jgi:hypothetical protein